MAKNFHFFKFIATEWLTGDIVYESFDVQGLFINICALYWQRDGDLSVDDIVKRYKDLELIAKLSDRYFSVSEGKISIKFLDEQLEDVGHISKVNSTNGKLGAIAKALKLKEIEATANRPLSEPLANLSKVEVDIEKEVEVDIEKKFTPPTLEAVKTYFKSKGYSENSASTAFYYYDAAKWHDSKGKRVKNWKQKMIGVWFKDENKEVDKTIHKMVY